ncbi:WYL domain-containing protein [Auritidibacter ignavus]|uniref:helix-turn-helix transcriptional regulator n=1 Tax=Auritidibacter TaxID=1160973 RepID=UPI000D727B7D|nr:MULTISPECIES: WYL domain-containing protein [Auritidibacter]PXA81523.1 hypothetical protein DCC25_03000 [Auritidibacter sp. NML120636]WGH82137.1 WYL domain-containing protein [Auritidibacter ignavus]WGH91331.1 WYL domain-containing protein [Auritidibacter ignavus]
MWLLLDSTQGLTKRQIRHCVDDYRELNDDSFDRQFTRDKTSLRDIGIPLVSDEIEMLEHTEHRYRIDRDQLFLPSIDLEPEEFRALNQARGVWDHTPLQAAARRATGRMGLQTATQYEHGTEPSLSAQLANTSKNLVQLSEMALAQQVIRFGYRAADGTYSAQRSVRAWVVVMANGQWYLVGWDLDRQAVRNFRLTRFTTDPKPVTDRDPNTLPTDSQRPVDLDVSALQRQLIPTDDPLTTVQVWVADGHGPQLRMLGTVLQSSSSTPGWDLVEIPAAHTVGIHQLLARAVGHVVVDPHHHPDLAQSLLAQWQQVIDAHQRPDPAGFDLRAPKRERLRAAETERIARLLDIVAILNVRGRTSREELKSRLGLSDQQLSKDLNVLQFCGMPERDFAGQQFDIDQVGDSVEIYQAEDLQAPRRFSRPEGTALLSALDALQRQGIASEQELQAIRSARAKIDRAIRTSAPADHDDPDQSLNIVALFPDLSLGPYQQLAQDIHRAISDRRVIVIDYYGQFADRVTTREIEPLRLLFYRQHTYVQAWCRRANAERSFRLDRIGRLAESEDTFTPRVALHALGLPTTGETHDDHETLVVQCLFSYRLKDLVPTYDPVRVAELDDGRVVAELRMHSMRALQDLVTSHPGEIQVLGTTPQSRRVRDELVERLDGAIATQHRAMTKQDFLSPVTSRSL